MSTEVSLSQCLCNVLKEIIRWVVNEANFGMWSKCRHWQWFEWSIIGITGDHAVHELEE
jgi:hypothetical protein